MAFNFDTFGRPTATQTVIPTSKPVPKGRFSFGSFGEELPPEKKRGVVGKVAEFLAPTATRTFEKLGAGEDIGARDVRKSFH